MSNLQRALHIMPAIVASPAFRAVYVEHTTKLLQLYGDLDYRALGARRSLLLYLLGRGELEGLCYLLGRPVQDQVVVLDGACYWRQPFLDNEELGIGRDIARIEFPTIGFFRLVNFALSSTTLTLELELHDLIWQGCSVDFELHALYGDGSLFFQSTGRLGENLYGYSLELSAFEAVRSTSGGLFSLAMRYTRGDISGVYRIGMPLLKAALAESMPLRSGKGHELICGPETGGCGVRLVE